MISPLKYDKRLATHLIQRGELKSEEPTEHLQALSDLSDKAISARREPELEEPEAAEGETTTPELGEES